MPIRQRFKPLAQIALSPAAVVLYVSLLLILLNIFLAAKTRPFNSDDVSWQNILLTWRPFNGHTAYLGGVDTFILKTPLFLLLGHFFSPSRKLLVLESGIGAAFAFTCFYISALYFLKKKSVKRTYRNLLPFAWFASFGYYIAQLYLNPILRSFEVGFSFITFVLVAKLYYREIDPLGSRLAKSLTVLACLAAGLLIFNDPYFLYFTLLPIGLLAITLWFLKLGSKRQTSGIIGSLLLSLVFAKLVAHLAHMSGIRVPVIDPMQFVPFEKLFSNIAMALHGALIIFGADFFGKNVFSLGAASGLINFALLIFICYSMWRLLSRAVRSEKRFGAQNLWPLFFATLGIFVFLVYSVNTLLVDIQTYRYLIIMAFSFILFLAIVAGGITKGRVFLDLLILAAIIGNLGVSLTPTFSAQLGSAGNQANTENFRIIGAIRNLGLTKGYAPYWDGNINSYLSGGSTQFLPILCSAKTTIADKFLVDDSQFSRPAKQTFYLIDPDLNFPPTCTSDQVVRQFGPPARTVVIPDKTIFIYNYDIYSKM